MHGRFCIIALVFVVGCTDDPAPAPQQPAPPNNPIGAAFDARATGVIRGRVLWDGDVPRGEVKTLRNIAFDSKFYQRPARFVLPHYPQVDAKSGGVENAVVFLRGIDPRRSRPWNLEPVRVEFQQRRLVVEQGKSRSGVGFVPRGDAIEFANRDEEYHVLRGRGAALFSFPLLEKDRRQSHTLTQAGIADLTCAAGYYWLHAHLFVVDHPYYARTDADGRFTFEQVPAGNYELVCWLPSWHVASHERDPETGVIVRLNWRPPVEQKRAIDVKVGGTDEVEYRWSAERFSGN